VRDGRRALWCSRRCWPWMGRQRVSTRHARPDSGFPGAAQGGTKACYLICAHSTEELASPAEALVLLNVVGMLPLQDQCKKFITLSDLPLAMQDDRFRRSSRRKRCRARATFWYRYVTACPVPRRALDPGLRSDFECSRPGPTSVYNVIVDDLRDRIGRKQTWRTRRGRTW
jgi:hypothetical protein